MFKERAHELVRVIEEAEYTNRDGGVLLEEQALELFQEMLRKSSLVYVVGNGGSAGIASHFHTDLVKALGIPSVTLFDSNLMTCISNDLGYEHVFSHSLKQVIKETDLLVAISSSGKSKNILNAVAAARGNGASVITLTGFSEENPLRKQGDLNIWLGVSDYGLVEIGHASILHTVVDHHARVKLAYAASQS